MKRLEFDCSFDLVEKIETIFAEINDDYSPIAVYGKYDVIKELLENLIYDGFSIINEIQLEDYKVSHYDKEFVLYVKPDGVNVEKTFVDDRYLYGSGDISFVHEDCSSTLLKYIESDKVYEFGYGDKNDFDEREDCDGKCCCDCKDDEIDNNTVSTTKSEYRVNGKITTKEEYDKALSDIEDKYMDNIRDMLLKYADFMEEWNEMLKLLY